MTVTINGEIHLEVEMTAEVSASENAGDLKVTVRVKSGDQWVDVDITSAVSEHDKKMALTAIEDEYRESEKWGA